MQPLNEEMRESSWLLAGYLLDQILIVKHALYDGEIRLAQDTIDELILKLKAI